ncbi:MAG TPA: hypothetical protein VEZ70_15395 [Allosphingosinicella sp.]|nr:hypothetical protein [Allosphingosinicella sp.]
MRTFLLHFTIAAAAGAPLLLVPAPASAATPVSRQMTCPVGGAPFTFTTVDSPSTWGARPDGKPYGSSVFPLALPECPDNGLVLFKDYEPAEVTKLEPIIASDAYQALRGEVPYYRAWWLMKELGAAPDSALYVLLQASWQAPSGSEQRARYLAAFAEESAKRPARPKDLNWIGMEGRAGNALRELGRFDEASARLAKVPLASLDVAAPAAEDRGAKANDARVRRGWREYFRDLDAAIARKDATLEPFDMLPRREWVGRCVANKGLSPAQATFCAENEAVVAQARAGIAAQEAELKRLAEQREKSGR